MRNGFSLTDLLVVVAMVAVLAVIIRVAVSTGCGDARRVRTQLLIDDFNQGVEKYINRTHKYPFVPAANGEIHADDCWRELSPIMPSLTAGRQPTDPKFRNKGKLECLSLTAEQLADLGDGKNRVIDAWGKPFCMQWDYFRKKTMIWSAGEDGDYNISDDPVEGGPSSLFCRQWEAKAQSFHVITAEDQEFRIYCDLSNF